MAVIPFYGASNPGLFAIERNAMDRPGLVTAELERILPTEGLVLDIGAGDGFTAAQLATASRRILAMEPAAGMVDVERALPWVQGDAERLPFRDATFDGVYATWAYFFSRNWDPTPGLSEAHRVTAPGCPIVIVENLGGDEFCSLGSIDITADPLFWAEKGFSCTEVDTVFEFESAQEATDLLTLFFGETGAACSQLSLSYRVGVFAAASHGPG